MNDTVRIGAETAVLMLAQKVAYVFSFTFFGKENYFWFLSVVLFIGSAVVFVAYFYQRPYYQEKT